MDTLPWRGLKLHPLPWQGLRLLWSIGWLVIFYYSCLVLHRSLTPKNTLSGRLIALAVANAVLLPGMFWILNYAVRKRRFNPLYFLAAILVLGALGRWEWALRVPTVPQSDFAEIHQIALGFSQGKGQPEYGRDLGYPALLSLAYRVYPDPLSGRVFNVLLSILAIYVVYRIGRLWGDPLAGLLCALFMALSIPDIMMTSVLCTEIGNLCLVMTALYFFLRALAKPEDRSAVWVSGLSLGLAALFRPVTLVYLPVFLMGIWVVRPHSRIKPWTAGAILVTAFLAVHALLVLCFSIATGRLTLLPLERPSAGATILSGTNFQSHGQWGHEVDELYWSWPESERLQRSISEGVHRITANPGGFLRLVPEKMVCLLADNTYASYWAFFSPPESWTPERVVIVRRQMAVLAQMTYILTLVAGFIYFLRVPRLDRLAPALLLACMGVTLLPHVLLEVQPRYHHILLGFLAITGGLGISQLFPGACAPEDGRQPAL